MCALTELQRSAAMFLTSSVRSDITMSQQDPKARHPCSVWFAKNRDLRWITPSAAPPARDDASRAQRQRRWRRVNYVTNFPAIHAGSGKVHRHHHVAKTVFRAGAMSQAARPSNAWSRAMVCAIKKCSVPCQWCVFRCEIGEAPGWNARELPSKHKPNA